MTGFVAYIWNEFWLLWNVIEDSYELAIAEKTLICLQLLLSISNSLADRSFQ